LYRSRQFKQGFADYLFTQQERRIAKAVFILGPVGPEDLLEACGA